MTENTSKTDKLLEAAAKGLGTSPEKLRERLKKGDTDGIGLPAEQAELLRRALGDEEMCRRVLGSPQVQAIMKKLGGK